MPAIIKQPIPFAGSSKLYIPNVTVQPLRQAYQSTADAIDSFEQGVKDAINAIAANAKETSEEILGEQRAYIGSAISGAQAAAENATGTAEDVLQGHIAWMLTIADDLGIPPSNMVAAARGQFVGPDGNVIPTVPMVPFTQPGPPGGQPTQTTPSPLTMPTLPPTGLVPPIPSPTPSPPPGPTPTSPPSLASDIAYWGEENLANNLWTSTVICQGGGNAISDMVTGQLLTGVPRPQAGIWWMPAYFNDRTIVISGDSTGIALIYVDQSGNVSRATDAQVQALIPIGPGTMPNQDIAAWLREYVPEATCIQSPTAPSSPTPPPTSPTTPPTPPPPINGCQCCPAPNITVLPCSPTITVPTPTPTITVYASDQAWLQSTDPGATTFTAELSAMLGSMEPEVDDTSSIGDMLAAIPYDQLFQSEDSTGANT